MASAGFTPNPDPVAARKVIRRIQSAYLDMVRERFGDILSRVVSEESYQPLRDAPPEVLVPRLAKFTEDCHAFWLANAGPLYAALRETGAYGLVTHGANITNDFILRHGLYYDTLLISDTVPLMHELNAMRQPSAILAGHLANILQHVISVDATSLLTTAETDVPILVHVPQVAFPGLRTTLLREYDSELDAALQEKVSAFALDADMYLADTFGLSANATNVNDVSEMVGLMSAEVVNRHVNTEKLSQLVGLFLARDKPETSPLDVNKGTLSRLRSRTLTELDVSVLPSLVRTPFNFIAVAEVQAGLAQMPHTLSPEMQIAREHRWTRICDGWSPAVQLGAETGVSAAFQERLEWLRASDLRGLVQLRETGLLEGMRETIRDAYSEVRASTVQNHGEAMREFEERLVASLIHHSGVIGKKRAEHKSNKLYAGLGLAISVALVGTSWILPDIPAARVALGAAGLLLQGRSVWDLVDVWSKGRKELAELTKCPLSLLLKMYEENR